MTTPRIRQQSGFTIIELMIATAVFSVVLLLCASGLIAVGRMYQKGNTSRATQEVARNLMDQIKDDFELSGGSYRELLPSGQTRGFCIGNNRYSYELNRRTNFDGSGSAFMFSSTTVGDASGDCSSGSATADTSTGRELLGPNMRLAQLVVTPFPSASNPTSIYIKINVVAGQDDLLSDSLLGCRGGPGQEYCAGSVLESYATRRLK